MAAAGYEPVVLRVEVAARATVRIDIGLTPSAVDATRPTFEVEVREAGGAPIDLATVELDGVARTALGGSTVFREVTPGLHSVRARRLGYQTRDTTISTGAGANRLVLRLTPRPRDLPTLAVSAPRKLAPPPISAPGDLSAPITTAITRLSREELQTVPPTFEPDVLRALQATTGIGAANDVNAHLAIRGSAPEHTLYLLDGAPVLGPYHMFGLFGAFNPDAVDDAQILRGSLPARVGGALGSVVSLRSARPERLRVVGGATVLTSRIAVSAPIGAAGSWLLRAAAPISGSAKVAPSTSTCPTGSGTCKGPFALPQLRIRKSR
ncbi:MAG: TonB-dependent receptor plug domain-containing protein [Gemmatimonadales bacterium]